MAGHTTSHCCDSGQACHDLDIFHSPMARFAFYVCLKMSPMAPVHPIGKFVQRNPDNLLFQFGEITKPLEVWTFFGDGNVADHALTYLGEQDGLPGIGIAMAVGTFQLEC